MNKKTIANPDVLNDTLTIAGRQFKSRLIIGTGKYASYAQNAEAADAAEVDLSLIHI